MAKVVKRASKDAEFRKLAVSDPREALKEATGLEHPGEFRLQVVDSTGYHATVVLPEARGAADELTDTDLEMVSGGIKDDARQFFEDFRKAVEMTAKAAVMGPEVLF